MLLNVILHVDILIMLLKKPLNVLHNLTFTCKMCTKYIFFSKGISNVFGNKMVGVWSSLNGEVTLEEVSSSVTSVTFDAASHCSITVKVYTGKIMHPLECYFILYNVIKTGLSFLFVCLGFLWTVFYYIFLLLQTQTCVFQAKTCLSADHFKILFMEF